MAIPVAPQENAGAGSKIIFLTYDVGGTNTASILRGWRVVTVNGTLLGNLGVYAISGDPFTGYKATAGAGEVAIAATTKAQGVTVKADPDNTEDIWVGPTGLTVNKSATDGYRLAPGEAVTIACQDLAAVFIKRGAATNQGVYFTATKD